MLPGNVWIHATLRNGRRADAHGLWVRISRDPQPFGSAPPSRLAPEGQELQSFLRRRPAQIDTLNKAAPGFFYLVSEAWWSGLILHIFRMTGGNGKALSLVTLTKLLPAAIRAGYEPKLKLALAASRFAQDLRHVSVDVLEQAHDSPR